MRQCNGAFLAFILSAGILFAGCHKYLIKKDYEQIPSMLNVLTNKAQSALEEGYLNNGEKAAREYIMGKNPDVLIWFDKNDYEVRMRNIEGYAVVLVCDNGKPVFEDTYCNPGEPDKDYRDNKSLEACEFTMTSEEVNSLCK